MQSPPYQLSADEALAKYNTSVAGLSKEEAKSRLALYGKNKLEMKKGRGPFKIFCGQFVNLLVIMMIIAGSISLVLREWRDAGVMFAIVFLNALVGFIQEYRAEKIVESLSKMVKAKAKVIRSGNWEEIGAEDLIPGDIVKLEEGDAVPADVRLIEENNLGTNDFSLTGESNPMKKFTQKIDNEVALGDRNNIVFLGTTVATGNGLGVVVRTGMKTEIGRIAHLSQETPDDLSPLQKEMNSVARRLALVAGIVAVFVFAEEALRQGYIKEAMIFAIAIAASCVPEGTPTQIVIGLSLSAARLAKERAVVKKLSAVETLGSTHIICTDKTGTLTKNEMTVEKFLIGKKEYSVTGAGYQPEGKLLDEKGQNFDKEEFKKLELFIETGILASSARIAAPDEGHSNWYAIGDPTEAALITFAEKAGYKQDQTENKFKKVKEFPFDASRKMMSSIREIGKGKYRVFVKGAPLVVLGKSINHFNGEKAEGMTQKEKDYYVEQNKKYADNALRVLAFAYKDLPSLKLRRTSEEDGVKEMEMEEAEKDLTFLGFAAMIDPPREEVKDAISAAKEANIRVIIITGDAARTAEAIAKKIGLVGEDGKDLKVIKGDELGKMSDIVLLQNLITKYIIFSRTSPEDKLRIVDLLKRAGEIVAVTGDGVNDAPALKRADIGVAMGRTGTEVAKESAEIILLDDSFATLVKAIREGRIIYKNLMKTVLSSVTSNGGELFAVLFSMLFGFLYDMPMAILAIQILAIDLIGEMAPLTALTWDPGEKDLLKEAPRNPTDHILNKKSLINIGWCGLLMGGFGFLNFYLVSVRGGFSWTGFRDFSAPVYLRATTLCYLTIIFVQWMNILSRRTERFVLSSYLWSNKKLLLSYAGTFIILLNIVYNPYISQFLGMGPLKLSDWGMAAGAAVLYLGIREGWKRVGARH